MALPLRQQFPALLVFLALAAHWAPELTEQQRSIGASALWLAAMIFGFVFNPPAKPVDQPPRIIWDERDEGEQFSIVMFHLLLAAIGFFIAYQMVQTANSPNGHWLMIVPAILVAGSTVWVLWANWKNRNAR